jgi:hypothetical protein
MIPKISLPCAVVVFGVLAIADEIDAERSELLEGIDQFLHRAREAVVAPDQ